MLRSPRKSLIGIALGIALWVSLPGAADATTAPGQKTVIRVTLSDRGISVQFQGEEARGVIVDFEAVNDGKKPHSFSVLGEKTPVLQPGQRAGFTVTLARRGIFPYRSTVDAGKPFRGNFIVY